MLTKWWQRYAPAWSPLPAEREIKWLIWLYIGLWLIEGALRKWLLPAYSAPLLIIRDPVAILIMLRVVSNRIWSINVWTAILWGIGVTSFIVSATSGVPLLVGFYGLRTVCLHWPLIFIFARVLNREDLHKLGTLFLDLALPMAVLMAFQFQAGPDAYISKGVGLDLGGQLDAGGGRIRPPGIFSFTSSVAQYYSLTLAILLHRFTSTERKENVQLLIPAMGVALAVAVSISRTLAASVVLVFVVFALGILRSGIPGVKIFGAILGMAGVAALLVFSKTATEGFGSLGERWTMAGDTFGTFTDRGMGMFSLSDSLLREAGPIGKGLGVGTNVGAQLLVGDNTAFLLAENEWDRVILEMGFVLGLGFALGQNATCYRRFCYPRRPQPYWRVKVECLRFSDLLRLLAGSPWLPSSLGDRKCRRPPIGKESAALCCGVAPDECVGK